MADLYDPDFGAAFYRSHDAIKNLRIKVRLERATSATIIPQSQLEQQQDGQVEMSDIHKQMQLGGQKYDEEYVFGWQEKVFSEREVRYYGDDANCVTVLERKYQQDTQSLRDHGRPTKRLFSYVEHDAFTNKDNNKRKFTTSPKEEPNLVSQKMTNVRHRRVGPARNRESDNSVVPKTNIVDYEPSEELRKQNHYMCGSVTTMYIMADVSSADKDPTEDDEAVLCTIKYSTNGVLSIKPDFTKGGRQPYTVDSGGLGRDLFVYTIQHMSQQLNWREQEREHKMFRELYNRHQEYLSAQVGFDMLQPPLDTLQLFVFGEILSAKDFEYDDLYVQYFVDLPDGWYPVSTPGSLQGTTQTCRCKTMGRDNVAYFSYPFQFELLYRKDLLGQEKDSVLSRWPTILLQVESLDSWYRHRVEGYGYVKLPSAPGVHEDTIHCWRPAGRTVFSELRRYFIGGSPELEDPTYTAVPSTFEGSHLGKFGFRTISTGNVTVKLNTVQQSQSFIQVAASKKKVGKVVDRIGFSAAQANIMNVIDAFQRAKQRMIMAREHLKKDFIDTLKTYASDSD